MSNARAAEQLAVSRLSREDAIRKALVLPAHLQPKALDDILAVFGPAEAQAQEELTWQEFVQGAWNVMEPQFPFMPNWHVDAIWEHLEALRTGEIRNLVISIPRRFGKSVHACVLFPARCLSLNPEMRFIFSSYSQKFSDRDSVKTRALVLSAWYQLRYGHRVQLSSVQNQKWRWDTTAGGFRIATSPGGVGLGEGGDVLCGDDLHHPAEVRSDKLREDVVNYWDNTLGSSVRDPRTVRKLVVMQRLHSRDVAGSCIDQGYDYVALPMEYEETIYSTSIGWQDPRQTPGELLWPARFTPAAVAKRKQEMSSYEWSSQMQQRPAPAGGGIFKRHWWRFWYYPSDPQEVVKVQTPEGEWVTHGQSAIPMTEQDGKWVLDLDEYIQSWDTTLTASVRSDYVVGQVWGRKGANYYLLWQVKKKLDHPATKREIRRVSSEDPGRLASRKLIEKKASGDPLAADLKNDIEGIKLIDPCADKVSRADAEAGTVESGNVYIPHPHTAGWVEPFIHAMSLFPNGENDDETDAATQALHFMRRRRPWHCWGGTETGEQAERRLDREARLSQ